MQRIHPPQIRGLNATDLMLVELTVRLALCPYCRAPFFLEEEIGRAFILQTPPDNITFFVHEECYNAELKYN